MASVLIPIALDRGFEPRGRVKSKTIKLVFAVSPLRMLY
jgi:hypothetical protein